MDHQAQPCRGASGRRRLLVVTGGLRQCHALTAAAVGAVAGSLVLCEVLRRRVLDRPDLVGAARCGP
ncbi:MULTISPECIES: hypothetical protein [Streptomyces]|uniref:hypothetical protein n=1 Tax=Streptomyces TaxID=1883 RepID=UPI0004BDAA9E|nr:MULTISPECIES: hypothetical protein [Streptomyces]KMS90485.1 hypothetical protein ACZ91_14810 [Streptomyces regensis]KOG69443.1 hypothetical protein ADK77_13265 [Streptomyces antibioticus]MBG7700121.1 hypothetical protein [Streptomyces sp. MC1]